MAKDINHDIPVQGTSYSGSDRAKQAVRHATGGNPITPATSGDPSATQTDKKVTTPDDKLKQTSEPRILQTNTKPISGGTPPLNINPEGRPGLGGTINKKARF